MATFLLAIACLGWYARATVCARVYVCMCCWCTDIFITSNLYRTFTVLWNGCYMDFYTVYTFFFYTITKSITCDVHFIHVPIMCAHSALDRKRNRHELWAGRSDEFWKFSQSIAILFFVHFTWHYSVIWIKAIYVYVCLANKFFVHIMLKSRFHDFGLRLKFGAHNYTCNSA